MVRTTLALMLLCLPALAGGAGKPSLTWKDVKYRLDDLPAELDPLVAETARPWAEWADAKGYEVELSDAADVILVVSKRQRKVENDFELVAKTIQAVDRFLEPRERAPKTTGGAPKEKKERGRLEDFDLPSLDKPDIEAPRLPPQIPVLFKAYNPRDYESGLDMLVEEHPWLKDWAKDTGTTVYGLVLPHPLVGAWLVNAPDNEEWNPLNEMVHRMAQMLVIDRCGVQPYWLQVGTAWHVELEVMGAIYCFPYRAEFVGVGEHGGWKHQLRNEFDKPKTPPPTMGEIAGLVRGEYDDRAAGFAWGTARWLVREHPERFGDLLRGFDAITRKEGIQVASDGVTWTTIPGWEIPDARQLETLQRFVSRSFLKDLGEAFADGV